MCMQCGSQWWVPLAVPFLFQIINLEPYLLCSQDNLLPPPCGSSFFGTASCFGRYSGPWGRGFSRKARRRCRWTAVVDPGWMCFCCHDPEQRKWDVANRWSLTMPQDAQESYGFFAKQMSHHQALVYSNRHPNVVSRFVPNKSFLRIHEYGALQDAGPFFDYSLAFSGSCARLSKPVLM